MSDKATVNVEIITVEWATHVLTHNTKNLPLRADAVNTMATDMAADRWLPCVGTISCEDLPDGSSCNKCGCGVLVDGQHRLAAIVQSGVPQRMIVVRHVPVGSREATDIGRVRKLGDVWRLDGRPDANTLAATAGIVWRLEHNRHLFNGAGIPRPSRAELEGVFQLRGAGLIESVRRADSLRKGALRYPPSLAAALHWMFASVNAEEADNFWERLTDGSGLLHGDPIFALRESLLKDLSQVRRMSVVYRAAITIKTWNQTREGKRITFVRWRRSGPTLESFPTIFGYPYPTTKAES